MDRKDSKYLLSTKQLENLLQAITSDYFLLKINDEHQFSYDTCYLDTSNLKCFRDHNKERRKRFKLRFRHYTQSKLYYFEVKIKGFRNLTHKYRKQITEENFKKQELSKDLKDFANQHLMMHYQKKIDEIYNPQIRVNYFRITLISKNKQERITIDNKITFLNLVSNVNFQSNSELWLMEVKSKDGRSAINQQLFQLGVRPTSKCSKYCLGISLANDRYLINSFTRVSKKLYSA
jgi:hypothetical protein